MTNSFRNRTQKSAQSDGADRRSVRESVIEELANQRIKVRSQMVRSTTPSKTRLRKHTASHCKYCYFYVLQLPSIIEAMAKWRFIEFGLLRCSCLTRFTICHPKRDHDASGKVERSGENNAADRALGIQHTSRAGKPYLRHESIVTLLISVSILKRTLVFSCARPPHLSFLRAKAGHGASRQPLSGQARRADAAHKRAALHGGQIVAKG